MQKTNWKHALASFASAMTFTGLPTNTSSIEAQENSRAVTVPAGLLDSTSFQSTPIQYLPFAHFAIPFDIDRTGRLPQEVHLWVSADQGKSWLKYASNSPDKRSFEFQAAAEGEYLFAVQTQDDRGASALAAAPPMRILVDTTKPLLQLNADINSAGRLIVEYRIEDRFLSEDSIKLSMALDGNMQWEEIRVGRLKRDGDVWSGQIELEMPRCHELELKLTASDLAQNRTETSSRYNAPRTAAASSGMQLASQKAQPKPIPLGARNIANQPSSNTSANSANTSGPTASSPIVTPQLSGPRAAANRVSQLAGANSGAATRANTQTSPSTNGQALESTAGAIAWEPTSSRSKPVGASRQSQLGKTVSSSAGNTGGSGLNSDDQVNLSSEPATSSQEFTSIPQQVIEELPTPSAIDDSTNVNSPALSSVLERAETPLPTRSVANIANTLPSNGQKGLSVESATNDISDSNHQTVVGSQSPAVDSPSVSELDSSKSPENESLPTIVNDAYHSRSRSFSLDYSVESLRGLAIADIELWGTDDRGKTWQKWGSDPDRESPFDVQVGTDGLYGFRMVIIGQNGLVSNRPNDGDSADMWINVDTKIPTVKITRALYGEGPDAGMLVIDYSCDDENLHDRPISLAYSERPTGPWSTIVNGLRNTGIYLWKADPNLPQQVYLRIQAVDRAGNVQEHRLDLPINLRGLTPRGRIQGFRPIDPK